MPATVETEAHEDGRRLADSACNHILKCAKNIMTFKRVGYFITGVCACVSADVRGIIKLFK